MGRSKNYKAGKIKESITSVRHKRKLTFKVSRILTKRQMPLRHEDRKMTDTGEHEKMKNTGDTGVTFN